MRRLAVALRHREESRQEAAVLLQFEQWQRVQLSLNAARPDPDSVALLRLDDIGDYLLWRNFLPAYRRYYAGKKLFLIGNKAWQPIFQTLDAANVDVFLELDKAAYMRDAAYRNSFWEKIRALGISELVCVSRTRPLLLDDCIGSATGAPYRIAAENSFRSESWNRLSDAQYTRLIPGQEGLHEFLYNRYFTAALTNISPLPDYLHLLVPGRVEHKRIICFIGASAKSKRWPARQWAQLIQLLQREGLEPLLSGGPSDREMADAICNEVPVDSEVGKRDLMQTLALIAGAPLLITGDTMAAHVGVGACVPTIILANGVNAQRFVAYPEAGYSHVETCYTEAFRNYKGNRPFTAVSRDMESIRPAEVLAAARKLLGHPVAHS